ncbi:MAG: fatty acid desaturase, partial [Myxococcaceae bacterium]
LINIAITWGLTAAFGFEVFVRAYGIPMAIAFAVGGYLFYAQHNYPDAYFQKREEWRYTQAALVSSSYMKMGPVMRYFTANIGFHHVHHLNPCIPYYRLPEAMDSMPALQSPGVTSLSPRAVAACFSLKLWDPRANRMVPFPPECAAQGNGEGAAA